MHAESLAQGRPHGNRGSTTLIAIVLIAILGVLVFIAMQPSAEERRIAIKTAMTYDRSIGEDRDLTTIFTLGLADGNTTYVNKLRQIPLENCPWSFKRAYEAHIAAWERRDKDDISRTWKQVKAVAREYGVDP